MRDRGRHWLTTWQGLTDDDEHAAHMVLTACRMWRFAAEGVHCGKVDAATWALGRDPSLAAVGPAVRRYTTGGHDRIEPAAIGHLLATVLRKTAEAWEGRPHGGGPGRGSWAHVQSFGTVSR
ncbi:aminoglycoside adenylyltransferase domain-containing protein [Dactylosporangium sp. NPDC005555]|uniref:aminoglycoside adenylyltransferase domain-containing protein n=1 Tax=Dactylosporangium sp. NPDC005555 TaxID=3154889 RepID=UPI00339EFF19